MSDICHNIDLNYFPKCENPLWINKFQMFVPCGKCFTCVSTAKKMYGWRCLAESLMHKFNYFVTLTFDSVRRDTSYSSFLRFYKKLTNTFGTDKLKYFVAYENGEINFRPHFHVLLFSDIDLIKYYYDNVKKVRGKIPVETLNEFYQNHFWYNGFVDFKLAKDVDFFYTSGYTMKKLTDGYNLKLKQWSKDEKSNHLYMFRCSYIRFSRSLGFSFYDSKVKVILDKGFIPYNNYIMPIPRSWFASRGFEKVISGNQKQLTREDICNLKIAYRENGIAKRSFYEIQKKITPSPF